MTITAEILADGLYFGEGPRWHDGRLWFSDFFAHAVFAMSTDGSREMICEVPNRPSGLGWLPDGRLLVVSMTDRKVMRREHDGTLVVHADLNHIATFHCNDMVVDAHGRAYVGNFGFDLDTAFETQGAEFVFGDPGPTKAKLTRVDPDGSTHVVADAMRFPNGSVITPDGTTLVVAESIGRCLTAFTIDADGSLSNKRVWADLGQRVPDGICLDGDGHIWVANPFHPECFLVAEGGEVLDVIETGDPSFACMLGGDDGRTLYCLTAPNSNAHVAAVAPKGHVRVARVAVAHAGLP